VESKAQVFVQSILSIASTITRLRACVTLCDLGV